MMILDQVRLLSVCSGGSSDFNRMVMVLRGKEDLIVMVGCDNGEGEVGCV